MRFSALALVSALAAQVSADSMASYTECNGFGVSCTSHRAVWYTAWGGLDIDANDKCRTGAAGMEHFCVDWANSRGEFKYPGGPKRCFRLLHRRGLSFCTGQTTCTLDTWDETPCTW